MFVTINIVFGLLLLISFHWTLFAKDLIPRFKGARERRLIVGGKEARPKQFPFAVSLQDRYPISQTYEHVCTFSLITTESVLGAAHCVVMGPNDQLDDVNSYIGVLGTVDHFDRTRYVTFDEFRPHPDYDSELSSNDIAILVLSEPVKIDEFVKTIPLIGTDKSFIGSSAKMIGWGSVSEASKPEPSRILKHVNADVISNQQCKIYYGILYDNEFCFGSYGKGGCTGDSGAPVIVRYRKRKVQMGVFSFNRDPCAEDPGTGLSVYHYKEWIERNAKGSPVFVL